MSKKIIIAWVGDSILDLALMSSLLWLNVDLKLFNIPFSASSALVGVGLTLLVVNAITYPKALKKVKVFEDIADDYAE